MRESLFLAGGIAAIGLASILTYGLRLGGLLLAEHLPATGPARRFLDALPSAILVSLVVPEALHARVPGMIGLTACLLVYWKSRNLLATMVAGVVAVALCR